MKGFTFPIGKPILTGITVFVLAVFLTFGIAYQSYLISRNEKQKEVLKEINSVKFRLQTVISNGLSASKTLAFIVNRYGTPADFDSIAKSILESNRFVDVIEFTKKGVITNIYPLKGNEAAMGFDILGDSVARKEAFKAISRKELFFAGPLELKQGGTAVVGRHPFFIDDEFEGFSIVIIKLPTLLEAAGINLQSKQFIYQLSKIDPLSLEERFILPASDAFDASKSTSVALPNGEWKLYVMHKDKSMPYIVIAFSFLGFLFSVTAGVFSWYLMRQPYKLNQLADKKAAELVKIKNRIILNEALLAEAQKAAKIGSWETDLVTLNVIWSEETFRIFGINERDHQTSHPHFLEFVHPKDREKVETAFVDSITNGILNILEHRIVTPKGEIKYVQERWRIFHDKEGKAVRAIGTCHDISERKQAQASLEESEAKYKYLFENNPMPMLLWDFETLKIIDCNNESLGKYGYSREEFLKMTIKDLRPFEDIALIESAVKSEETYGEIHKGVWRHKKKNGEVIFVDVSAHLINYNNRRVSLTMLDDVTEKLKAEKEITSSYNQLQELTAHLQTVREEERTRIAREIHDELGQQLTVLKMDASWIRKKITKDNEPIAEKLYSMIDLIDDTVKTVRRISSDLRPGILDDLGLIPALEWQGEEYEKRTGIKWHFHANVSDITLEPDVSTNIFRIFQEAFTNIIRHSDATQIETQIEKDGENLLLAIKDNGQGFDLDTIKHKNSWGIIGMKERAAILKGELIIESEKQKGTTIRLQVPLH